MKVRLHNDGKEKAQSFEVHAETDFNYPDSHGSAVEWKNDYWREGYTPEDAMQTFMQQTG